MTLAMGLMMRRRRAGSVPNLIVSGWTPTGAAAAPTITATEIQGSGVAGTGSAVNQIGSLPAVPLYFEFEATGSTAGDFAARIYNGGTTQTSTFFTTNEVHSGTLDNSTGNTWFAIVLRSATDVVIPISSIVLRPA